MIFTPQTLPKRLRHCKRYLPFRSFPGTVMPETMPSMDATTARTHNIRLLVREAGGPTRFAEQTSDRWSQAQISQWISATNPKGIGHKVAREIERRLDLAPGSMDRSESTSAVREPRHSYEGAAIPPGETATGYVRFQLFDGAGGMGPGVVNDDYPEVIRQVDLAEWEVRRKIGFVPTPGRISLITGRGPSMRPLIDHGDVVMVDTSVDAFAGDATYVVNVGGETQIKMLQMRIDGLYVVSANTDYPAYRVERMDGLHIGGKVVSVLGLREL